jgi:predicted ATP-grasp superfamily ATP-dependent carboligase
MIPVVSLGGLHLVRALGMAGIPVLIASSQGRTPAMASRYCAGTLALPSGGGREAIVQALAREGRRLAEAHGRPVPLFYDNDDRLALVQDFRAELSPHFALLLNEPHLGEVLLDKERFQAFAERKRLPVPRRIGWQSLGAEPGAVLAKPRTRTGWDDSPVRTQLFGGHGKARVFASGREARLDPLVQQLAAQLQFQEYVPGGDDTIWSFHGFAAPGGEVLEGFVGRKIRTFPVHTGDSAYLRLAHEPALVSLGRDIAARLALAGIFKMDFKRHPQTGRFYLLEINTRFNLWQYLGAKNGVYLARVAYEFLLYGRRPQPARASTRYRWLAWRYDRRAFRELHSRGELGTAAWLWSLAQAPKVYEYFAWSDPMPLARLLHARVNRRWQRLWHSMAS